MDSDKKSFPAYILPALLPSLDALVLFQNLGDNVDKPRGGLAWLKRYYDEHRARWADFANFSSWKQIDAYGLALIKAKSPLKLTPRIILDALCGLVKFEPFGGIELKIPKMLIPLAPGLTSTGEGSILHVVDYKFNTLSHLANGEEIWVGADKDQIGIVIIDSSLTLDPADQTNRRYSVVSVKKLLEMIQPNDLYQLQFQNVTLPQSESERDYLAENFPTGTSILVSKKFHSEFTQPRRRYTPVEGDPDVVETVVINEVGPILGGEFAITADVPGEINRASLRSFEIKKFTPKLSGIIKKAIQETIEHALPRAVKKSYFKPNAGPPIIKGIDISDPTWPFGNEVESIPIGLDDLEDGFKTSVTNWFTQSISLPLLKEGLKTGEFRFILSKDQEFRPTKDGKILTHWKPISLVVLPNPIVEIRMDSFRSLVSSSDPKKDQTYELIADYAVQEIKKKSSSSVPEILNVGTPDEEVHFSLKVTPWVLHLFKNEKFLDAQIQALSQDLTSVTKIHLHHKLLARKLFETSSVEESLQLPQSPPPAPQSVPPAQTSSILDVFQQQIESDKDYLQQMLKNIPPGTPPEAIETVKQKLKDLEAGKPSSVFLSAEIPPNIQNLMGWTASVPLPEGQVRVTVVKYAGMKSTMLGMEPSWEVKFSDGRPNRVFSQAGLLSILKLKPPQNEPGGGEPSAKLIQNVLQDPHSVDNWRKLLVFAKKNSLKIDVNYGVNSHASFASTGDPVVQAFTYAQTNVFQNLKNISLAPF